MSITTINPANGKELKIYKEITFDEIDQILLNSLEAFESWKMVSFADRAKLMKNVAEVLRNKKNFYAELMALEMGKPVKQGIAEAEKCAWACDYYAENAEIQLKDEFIKTEMAKSYVAYQPLGPVLAIMPWNFPFWQVFRFAAPTLMAGNTCLLKHSSNTMGCAIEIENIFFEAGFPPNVFSTLVIGSKYVGSVIEHPAVQAVTLTGSTPVGMQVAAKAGSLIKKTVLELGGSDPYIILKDAELERAAETCVNARLINSGQSCIAAKRFIVESPVIDEFTELFVNKMKTRKMGDPFDTENHVGPQARKDLQLDLQRQVDESVRMGAKILLGGFLPEGNGFYYPPTILAHVKKGMPAYDEEIFGPVAPIIEAKNEDDAIRIANDTIFGLGAAIFSSDIEKAENMAKTMINAGSVFVNDFVKSDPRLPFGGILQSGYGRELSSFGIKEFVNIKTVCVG